MTVQGCAGAGATILFAGAGAATSVGIDHTLSGIAYKTFTADMSTMRVATRRALDAMAIRVEDSVETADGYEISGKAHERTVEIELEKITRAATRMRVTVIEEGGIFRDSATATEIILQTAGRLETRTAAGRS